MPYVDSIDNGLTVRKVMRVYLTKVLKVIQNLQGMNSIFGYLLKITLILYPTCSFATFFTIWPLMFLPLVHQSLRGGEYRT